MDISKAHDLQLMEETLFVWMAIHGNLSLALRHPQNTGASREYVEQFVDKLGQILVDRGLLSPVDLANHRMVERWEAKKKP